MNKLYDRLRNYIVRHEKQVVVSGGIFLLLLLPSGFPYFNLVLTPLRIASLTVATAVLLLNIPAKHIAKGLIFFFLLAFIFIIQGLVQEAKLVGDGIYLLLWVSVFQLLRN